MYENYSAEYYCFGLISKDAKADKWIDGYVIDLKVVWFDENRQNHFAIIINNL